MNKWVNWIEWNHALHQLTGKLAVKGSNISARELADIAETLVVLAKEIQESSASLLKESK